MKRFDRWDLLASAGATLIAMGLWGLCPPMALIFLGVCAVGLALWGAKVWPK